MRQQPIPGFAEYEITDTGEVWSYKKKYPKRLKSGTTEGGYNIVSLWMNNKGKSYLVHRLVAQAYIPNPNNYPYVCHKKEMVPANDEYTNLSWGTAKMNMEDCSSKNRIWKGGNKKKS